METTRADPVIAEVHAVRDDHAARFEYNLPAIFRDIRSMQNSSGKEFVRYPTRKVSAKSNTAHN